MVLALDMVNRKKKDSGYSIKGNVKNICHRNKDQVLIKIPKTFFFVWIPNQIVFIEGNKFNIIFEADGVFNLMRLEDKQVFKIINEISSFDLRKIMRDAFYCDNIERKKNAKRRIRQKRKKATKSNTAHLKNKNSSNQRKRAS